MERIRKNKNKQDYYDIYYEIQQFYKDYKFKMSMFDFEKKYQITRSNRFEIKKNYNINFSLYLKNNFSKYTKFTICFYILCFRL